MNTLPTIPTVAEVEEAIGRSFKDWSHQCHVVSLAIVKSGLLAESRVARGWSPGVGSQHSWVVIGDDCYDPVARIVDATLWSYDDKVEGIWTGMAKDRPHVPHGGFETIWEVGRPPEAVDDPIELAVPVSEHARQFLDLCGPLDYRGWGALAHGPMRGWPAAEIIAAMDDTPALKVIVPIDILGMITTRNPKGLYLPEAS